MGKSLQIKLGHSGEGDLKPTIRPGMILYGEVRCKPTDRELLTALTVNLLGNSVVKGPKGRRELTQLFSVQHPILRREDKPIVLHVKEHKFPFHFVVPWTTEYDRAGVFEENTDDIFTDMPHKIPPTLGSKTKGSAEVRYSISAVARKRNSQNFSLNSSLTSVLNQPEGVEIEDIRCIVEMPNAPQAQKTQAQCILLPPTAKQGIFRRGSTAKLSIPNVKCVVSLSGQSTVILDDAFELTADIRYDPANVLREAGQQWYVAVSSVALVAKTYRRFRAGDMLSEEECTPLPWSSKPVTLTPELALSRAVIIKSASEIVPSFKSYSISRAYEIRLSLSSVLRGSKTATEGSQRISLPVEVMRRGDALLRRGSNPPPQDVYGRPVEPPAYEDSPAYS